MASLFFVFFLVASVPSLALNHVTYHNATGAHHQKEFNRLYKLGYRLQSIGVHGTKAKPRYSAVWVKKSGGAWMGFHGRKIKDYQSLFNTWTKKGYHPVLLSVSGSGSNAVMAGMFEKKSGAVPLTRYGLISGKKENSKTIQYWIDWARKNDQIPSWISLYGSSQNPRYAVIFRPNHSKVSWAVGLFDTASTYQSRFSAQAAQWARPALISVSSYHRYVSLFVDDQVGAWVARHNRTWSQYQSDYDTWSKKGFYPLIVQGGSHGAFARYCAVFVKKAHAIRRQFKSTGVSVSALRGFDQIMRQHMQANQVRGGALAIVQGTRLVFARGYTWAEPGYPTTQPENLFRIASLTKPITSIAIHQAIEDNRVQYGTRFQDVLSLRQPGGNAPADFRMRNITIAQLLTHVGGWDRAKRGDLASVTATANSFSGLPISLMQWAREKMKDTLEFSPGRGWQYSNFGFLLLGEVLRDVYGRSYRSVVANGILNPLGLSRPRLARPAKSQAAVGEVRYHDSFLRVQSSVLNNQRKMVPRNYGGEDLRLFAAFGGWLFSAVDYARVLAAFSERRNPLLSNNSVAQMWLRPFPTIAPNWLRGWFRGTPGSGVWTAEHGGSLSSVSTVMGRRSDGLSIVAFFNKGNVGTPWAKLNNLAASTPSTAWPRHNLFARYGIR